MAVRTLDKGAVQHLEESVKGSVLTPGSDGYDEARTVFNAMIDRRPAAIVRCLDAQDVMAAVDFARGGAFDVAVRGAGHGVTGTAVCDDGIVIDLSPMKRIAVDAGRRTVKAEAGVTWGELDAETQKSGLAVTGGRVSTTGISGLTLGSGSGWLERSLGFTCDNLISVDVVTADGSFVHASRDEHPDLFWALRGGGGNFGVVTDFELRLHPVGPTILGGMLMFPAERAEEVLRGYRDVMVAAPDELGGAAAVLTAPPLDFVPEPVRGKKVVGIIVACAGDPEEGKIAARPLRDLGPAVDMVAPMPYVAVQRLIDAANPPGMLNYWKADLVDELTDAAIAAFVEAALGAPSPHSQSLLQPLGGAVRRAPGGETPLQGRNAGWAYHALGVWDDAAASDENIGWARRLGQAMRPYSTGGVYLTYSSDSGEPDRVMAAFGADNYRRLVAIKDRYDPGNLFRLNQNIPPSAQALARSQRGG